MRQSFFRFCSRNIYDGRKYIHSKSHLVHGEKNGLTVLRIRKGAERQLRESPWLISIYLDVCVCLKFSRLSFLSWLNPVESGIYWYWICACVSYTTTKKKTKIDMFVTFWNQFEVLHWFWIVLAVFFFVIVFLKF